MARNGPTEENKRNKTHIPNTLRFWVKVWYRCLTRVLTWPIGAGPLHVSSPEILYINNSCLWLMRCSHQSIHVIVSISSDFKGNILNIRPVISLLKEIILSFNKEATWRRQKECTRMKANLGASWSKRPREWTITTQNNNNLVKLLYSLSYLLLF